MALTARLCAGQVPPSPQLLIHLPPGIASESVFIRYVLAGEKFGGWVRTTSGVSSYIIVTTVGGIPSTGIKAIVYAPGCSIDTLDLRLSKTKDEEFSFRCRPLGTARIAGRIIESDALYRHGATLQARYIVRWAHRFLGLADDSVLVIPVGNADLSADGRFRIAVPDLSRDPLAGAPRNDGELQIWAKDRASQHLLAQVAPTGAQGFATRMGGMKIQGDYPSEVLFGLCAIAQSPLHDESGFAHRSDIDGCERGQ